MEVTLKNKVNIKEQLIKFQSLIALLLMVVLMGFLSDKFMSVDNLWNVMRQISVNVCISVGMTLVILTAGIDLSVGSILAFSGAVGAGLLQNGIAIPQFGIFIGFTLLGAILAALVAGSLLGLVNGIAITRFNVQPFVATLAMLNYSTWLDHAMDGGISDYRSWRPFLIYRNGMVFGYSYAGLDINCYRGFVYAGFTKNTIGKIYLCHWR